MELWVIWLIVAVAAIVGEVLTTGLFLASIALAAIVAAIIALALPALVPVQLLAFAGVSLAGIAVIRPFVVRAMGLDSLAQIAGPAMHSDLVGRRAVVTQAVDAHDGQIRIGSGEFWSARTFDPNDVAPVGAPVDVVLVDGLTALITPASISESLESESSLLTEKGT